MNMKTLGSIILIAGLGLTGFGFQQDIAAASHDTCLDADDAIRAFNGYGTGYDCDISRSDQEAMRETAKTLKTFGPMVGGAGLLIFLAGYIVANQKREEE
jgi:hypothetical protein